MRIHELFESELISEIQMSPTRLKTAASQIEAATTGLEFEMYFPGEDREVKVEDTETGDIENILRYFSSSNSERALSRLETELQESLTEYTVNHFDAYWDDRSYDIIFNYVVDNMSDDDIRQVLDLDEDQEITDDHREDAARTIDETSVDPYYSIRDSEMEDYVSNNVVTESEWLDAANLNMMSDVARLYRVSMPTSDEDTGELTGEVLERISKQLEPWIQMPVKYSTKYHGVPRVSVDAPPENRYWIIEPDSSLTKPRRPGDYGIEIISPPISVEEMVEKISSVKKFMQQNGAYTSKGEGKDLDGSTGLHMNVGLRGIAADNIDYVKLVLLLGDDYVLDQFERSTSRYSVPALSTIKGEITADDAAKYLEQIRSGMQSQALSALNKMAKFRAGSHHFSAHFIQNADRFYVEFRSPGGNWDEKTADELSAFLRRFVITLDAASRPEAFKKEYLSKLNRLLTSRLPKSSLDTIQYFSRFSAKELPKQALKSFVKQAQLQRQVQRNQLPPGKKIEWEVLQRDNLNQQNYSSVMVIAATADEAIEQARNSSSTWRIFRPDALVARPFRADPEISRRSLRSLELNGRPSNPDGNAYIAAAEDPTIPLYRFMAANGDDASTVLGQWQSQYGPNYVWRPDHLQLRGQPAGITQSSVTTQTRSPEPRFLPGRDYYPAEPTGRFILRSTVPPTEDMYRFNLPSDTVNRPDYMNSAELNAIRFLRDNGYEEEQFPEFVIHDTRDGSERELA